MTNTEKILAEFDEEFAHVKITDRHFFNPWIPEMKSFIIKSINQALTEDRERMRGIIDWELTPHEYESDDPLFERFAIRIKEKYKNKLLSSLDKPLTDKE